MASSFLPRFFAIAIARITASDCSPQEIPRIGSRWTAKVARRIADTALLSTFVTTLLLKRERERRREKAVNLRNEGERQRKRETRGAVISLATPVNT